MPHNTVTVANIPHMHITIRNLGIASVLRFWKKIFDGFSSLYSYETSIFTLGAPHEKVQGRQTKLHPGFILGKLVQPFPGYHSLIQGPNGQLDKVDTTYFIRHCIGL